LTPYISCGSVHVYFCLPIPLVLLVNSSFLTVFKTFSVYVNNLPLALVSSPHFPSITCNTRVQLTDKDESLPSTRILTFSSPQHCSKRLGVRSKQPIIENLTNSFQLVHQSGGGQITTHSHIMDLTTNSGPPITQFDSVIYPNHTQNLGIITNVSNLEINNYGVRRCPYLSGKVNIHWRNSFRHPLPRNYY